MPVYPYPFRHLEQQSKQFEDEEGFVETVLWLLFVIFVGLSTTMFVRWAYQDGAVRRHERFLLLQEEVLKVARERGISTDDLFVPGVDGEFRQPPHNNAAATQEGQLPTGRADAAATAVGGLGLAGNRGGPWNESDERRAATSTTTRSSKTHQTPTGISGDDIDIS
ncbi:unnamed protein product [Amoebophrya sp. A120]|nr:unnamed protein product [Amoebophrya sp. A120]|eukprot:GSA120T00005012001.1